MDTLGKTYLRKHYLQKRHALAPKTVDALNLSLLGQVRVLDWSAFAMVHVYLPILAQKEPDTFRIISWMREAYPGMHIAVPRVSNVLGGRLSHYILDEGTELKQNKWGIPEPRGGGEVDPKALDAVILPMLAFDLTGHRVGYGQGFYDRFLSECRPDVWKIGLSFFDPVPRITDVLETDIPMDCCITPKRFFWFRERGKGSLSPS